MFLCYPLGLFSLVDTVKYYLKKKKIHEIKNRNIEAGHHGPFFESYTQDIVQVNLCELKTSLVYRLNSRPARAT